MLWLFKQSSERHIKLGLDAFKEQPYYGVSTNMTKVEPSPSGEEDDKRPVPLTFMPDKQKLTSPKCSYSRIKIWLIEEAFQLQAQSSPSLWMIR